jgi:hypothetical protein
MQMRIAILLIFSLFLSLRSMEQTTKNTWLLGGNGSLDIRKNTLATNAQRTQTTIQVDGKTGYFVANNLVLGLNPMWNYYNYNYFNYNSFYVGPFIRGYLLPAGKKSNIILGASSGYFIHTGNSQSINDNFTIKKYMIEAGYTYFLNQSLGIEILTSYETEKFKKEEVNISTMSLKIGFQLYLKKR